MSTSTTGKLTFGSWLKERRSQLGLTQEELSQHLGFSPSLLRKLESGERRPSGQIASQLAVYFRIPADEQEAFVVFARTGPTGPTAGGDAPAEDAPSGASTPSSAPWRGTHLRQANLPFVLSPIIGREDEEAKVREHLLNPKVRLLTLTGAPGIGKTRLALQVASAMVEHFEDGVFFVELAPVTDPGMVLVSVARALGLTDSERPLEERLFAYVRARRLLLVLDNFEQVLDAAMEVVRLLEGSPWLKILVTSREALRVRGERRFPVPPLTVPSVDSRRGFHVRAPGEAARAANSSREREILTGPLTSQAKPQSLSTVARIGSYSSVKLFLESAKIVQPDFDLTEENSASVASICARLDGLPLAIELAAAHVNLFSPGELEAQLAGSLRLLKTTGRDLPARQRTLYGAIDWSYRLLTVDEQALFRQLGVFVGGGEIEAAKQVAGPAIAGVPSAKPALDLMEGLETLLNKSLLTRSDPAPGAETGRGFRLGMLETIREYALDELAAYGEEAEARDRHSRYYLSLAQEAASNLAGSQQAEWLNLLEVEHDNMRSALEWLLEGEPGAGKEPAEEAMKKELERIETGAQLCVALFRFWSIRAYYSEARAWFHKAADRIQALIDPSYLSGYRPADPGVYRSVDLGAARHTSPALALLLGTMLSGVGVFAYDQSDFEAARAFSEAGLSARRQMDDKVGIAGSLGNLGNLAVSLGDLEAAKRYLTESLALRRELGNEINVAFSLNDLGIVECDSGNFERARSLYEESLAIAEKLGNRDHMGRVLSNLGIVLRYQGDFGTARECLERAFQLQTELGKWHSNGLTFANMALVARDEGRYEEARHNFLEGLTIVWEAGDSWATAECLEGMASLAAVAGDAVRTAVLFGSAEALREAIRGPVLPVERKYHESYIALVREAVDPEEWRAAWEKGRVTPLDEVIKSVLSRQSPDPRD